MLSLKIPVEITTASAIMERIKARAIERWGDKWLVRIATEYARLARENGDPKATTTNRRPQLQRAFEAGSCTLDTAILLAASVNCKFQMACTEIKIEIEEF